MKEEKPEAEKIGRPVLSKKKQEALERNESVLGKGDSQSLEKGYALREIRDWRLYLAKSDTFDGYCRGQWDMIAKRADQLIKFADVLDTLKRGLTGGEPLPIFERQVRLLGPLSEEGRIRVWRRAVKLAGTRRPTSKDVENALTPIGTPMPGRRTFEREILETFPVRARIGETIKEYIVAQLFSQHPGEITSFGVVTTVRGVTP